MIRPRDENSVPAPPLKRGVVPWAGSRSARTEPAPRAGRVAVTPMRGTRRRARAPGIPPSGACVPRRCRLPRLAPEAANRAIPHRTDGAKGLWTGGTTGRPAGQPWRDLIYRFPSRHMLPAWTVITRHPAWPDSVLRPAGFASFLADFFLRRPDLRTPRLEDPVRRSPLHPAAVPGTVLVAGIEVAGQRRGRRDQPVRGGSARSSVRSRRDPVDSARRLLGGATPGPEAARSHRVPRCDPDAGQHRAGSAGGRRHGRQPAVSGHQARG